MLMPENKNCQKKVKKKKANKQKLSQNHNPAKGYGNLTQKRTSIQSCCLIYN